MKNQITKKSAPYKDNFEIRENSGSPYKDSFLDFHANMDNFVSKKVVLIGGTYCSC